MLPWRKLVWCQGWMNFLFNKSAINLTQCQIILPATVQNLSHFEWLLQEIIYHGTKPGKLQMTFSTKCAILYRERLNMLCSIFLFNCQWHTVYAIIFAYSYFRGFGQVR